MIAVLLILSIIAQVSQQVCRKEHNKRENDNPLSFSVVGVLAALVYFVVLSKGQLSFSPGMFLYSLPFAICYMIAYVCTIYAIKHGPLSITSLIISCSVAVPLIYGIVFLKEPVNCLLILGLVLLFLSIIFVSEPWKREEMRITTKWVVYISVTFFSNGFCMTIQKLFQMKDYGVHSNEFMICSLALTFLLLLLLVLVCERKGLKKMLKTHGIIWPVFCGVGNGIANQVTMILAVVLPASFLYPMQSAGAIVLTAIVSILLYKEKLSLFQKIGFVTGVLAIIVFNV